MYQFQSYILPVLLILTLMMVGLAEISAQCPMCKATVESAMKKDENTIGMGLNDGILYLLAAPYLVAATVGFLWYWNVKKGGKAAA